MKGGRRGGKEEKSEKIPCLNVDASKNINGGCVLGMKP